MPYTTIVAYDPTDLIRQVNEAEVQNWTPIGGVSVYTDERRCTVFLQALVKQSNPEVKNNVGRPKKKPELVSGGNESD